MKNDCGAEGERTVTIMAQKDVTMNYISSFVHCYYSVSKFCKTHQPVVSNVLLAEVKMFVT